MSQPNFKDQMNHKNTGLLAPNGARARVSTFVLRYLWPSPPWAERVPDLKVGTGGRTELTALSPGERVSRSGAFTSRSGTGEGSLAQFRESTSSATRPGLAGETGGEPYAFSVRSRNEDDVAF